MNLQTFNTTNITSKPRFHAIIGLNAKSGLINFNCAACERIEAKNGDMVQLHQDLDEEGAWYLEKCKENGFVLRQEKNVTRGLIFNSIQMVRKIFESMNYVETSGKIGLGEEIVFKKKTLVTLITALLKNK